jgi:transcriptional regulator with XRE-family HTH domain
MEAFKLSSPSEVIIGVAHRLKRRRIDANLTQRELASRSGVSYGSLRLIEDSGKGAFEALVKIAFTLDAEGEFEVLFPSKPIKSLDDVVTKPLRQRVRKS